MLSKHLILCHSLLFCLQSFSPSESFPMSWLFASGSRSIGTSASASVLPVNLHDWFPLRLTGLILQLKRLSRVFSSTTIKKHQFFGAQPPLWSSSHTTTGETIALIIWTFVGKVPNTLPSWISFSLEWFWSLPPVQCHEPPSIVFQVLCLPDLILWICLSLLLYNLKGFDLGDTWMAWVIFPTFFNLSLNF